MKSSGIIYYYAWDYSGPKIVPSKAKQKPSKRSWNMGYIAGIGLIALALGGIMGPLTPVIRMEAGYRLTQAKTTIAKAVMPANAGIQRIISWIPGQAGNDKITRTITTPVVFTPLTAPDGSAIKPVDTNFGLIIPKIGVNAKVIPAVNPTSPGEYEKALTQGVAHASTSYFPNENGTVYLFSHSTGYDWFVKDLNAVFYLVKNLDTGDTVVLIYKGKEYTYKITEKKIVSPESVSYLVPHAGTRNLILQTCWPPGSVAERLLIFADLTNDSTEQI